MRDIATKTDGTSTLAATDFNALQVELENVVTTADDTLDSAGGPDNDLNMLAKALAGYAGAAWAYQDSGAADAYVLAIASNLKAPTKYFDNMMVAFKPGNDNTGASTINVAGLGAKDIKIETADPVAGEIEADKILILKFNDGSDYFEIVAGAGTFTKRQHDHTDVASGGFLDTVYAALRPYQNLIIKNGGTPDEQVDIDADWVILKDVSGNPLRIDTPNFTADNTASGQNGLFTGSVAANTWYAVWLTSGASGNTSGLHLSGDLATVLGDAPAGYEDYGLLVGWMRTDATDDFILLHQLDNKVVITDNEVLTAGNDTSFTSVDLSGAVPSIAKKARGYLAITTSGDSVSASVASDANGLGENSLLISPASTIYDGNYGREMFDALLITPQVLFYKMNDASDALDGYITGWEY